MRWMLVIALLAGCKDKPKDTGVSATALITKMGELKSEMCQCKDAACAQSVSTKMTEWSKANPQPAKMSAPDTQQVGELGTAMSDCMQTAMTAGSAAAAGSADEPSTPSPADLPPECKDYEAAIERLQACDKMPQAARDTLKKAFDDAKAGWAKLDADSKVSLGRVCKEGATAVLENAKGACGW